MADVIARKAEQDENEGVMSQAVTLAGDLTEQGLDGSIAIAKAVRGHLFRVAQGGVDWVQSVEQVPFALLREVIQRADQLSLKAVEGVESIAMSTTRVFRRSGEAAVALVARTSESLVAPRGRSEKAA
jgi:hypothetical protein